MKISKIVIYKFWYDYIKPKYGGIVKLFHMKSLQKNKDSYSDIEKHVETRFETSNYELHRPFPKGKN